MEVLDALLGDLSKTSIDHVVITGDLTYLGLPGEFRQAARWLASVGPPERVMVVPGNHDAYVATSRRETFDLWAPYMTGDGDTAVSTYPRLRVRGPIALIGLSSARPSAPLLAVGSLGNEQLARFEQILQQTGRRGLLRIVLIHHPPIAGSIAWRKRLTDAPLFAEVLKRQGAELILHGHAHVPLFGSLSAAHQEIPVFGVPSASHIGFNPRRTSRYHRYRLHRENGAWILGLTVRGYSRATKRFSTLQKREIPLPVFVP